MPRVYRAIAHRSIHSPERSTFFRLRSSIPTNLSPKHGASPAPYFIRTPCSTINTLLLIEQNPRAKKCVRTKGPCWNFTFKMGKPPGRATGKSLTPLTSILIGFSAICRKQPFGLRVPWRLGAFGEAKIYIKPPSKRVDACPFGERLLPTVKRSPGGVQVAEQFDGGLVLDGCRAPPVFANLAIFAGL